MITIVVLTVFFLVAIVLIGLYARRAERLRDEGAHATAPHDHH
jgi:hypothetical protein